MYAFVNSVWYHMGEDIHLSISILGKHVSGVNIAFLYPAFYITKQIVIDEVSICIVFVSL